MSVVTRSRTLGLQRNLRFMNLENTQSFRIPTQFPLSSSDQSKMYYENIRLNSFPDMRKHVVPGLGQNSRK